MITDKLKLLKLGGQYKVKSFARLMEEYGSDSSGMPNVICGFNEQMKKLCGQKITIHSAFEGYENKLYHIKETRYCWNSQMLELPLSTLIYRRKHG